MISMREKYSNDSYAVYNGVRYSAGDKQDGRLVLRSFNEEDEKKGFIPSQYTKGLFLKYVTPYEVTEYYKERFSADYNGQSYSIWDEESTDDEVAISFVGSMEEYPGFTRVDKASFFKRVSESELRNIKCTRYDFLKNAREYYDSKMQTKDE